MKCARVLEEQVGRERHRRREKGRKGEMRRLEEKEGEERSRKEWRGKERRGEEKRELERRGDERSGEDRRHSREQQPSLSRPVSSWMHFSVKVEEHLIFNFANMLTGIQEMCISGTV